MTQAQQSHLLEAARLLRLAFAIDNDQQLADDTLDAYARDMAAWMKLDERERAASLRRRKLDQARDARGDSK